MTGFVDRARLLPKTVAAVPKPAVRRMWRHLLLRSSVDETTVAARRSAVVIAPHPDDETLGCGATIARKRAAGTDVVVVVVTDGRHSHRSQLVSPDELALIRADEARAACARLGVERAKVHFLGFEEAAVGRQLGMVTEALAEILSEVRPDDVLTTSRSDWHLDHQAVSAATRAAVLLAGGAPRLLEYPIWWWVDGPWTQDPDDTRARVHRYLADPLRGAGVRAVAVSTGAFREAKRSALSEYRSQTTNLTGETGWAVMDDDLLALFLGRVELFVPVPGAEER